MDGTAAPGPGRDQFREVAARLAQPAAVLRQLLADVLRDAVAAVGASGGSVLVPDEDGQSLRFLVSHGPGADKLADLKVPLEGSIVGSAYSTGVMMAVGDLEEEQPANYYAEVSKQTGVSTRTYLALPILHGGRPCGAATYINRAGSPPFQPFQPEEMTRARNYAVLEGVLLRYLERTWELARSAGYDLSVVWAAMDPEGADPGATRIGPERPAEAWARLLRHLDHLSTEDQDFCADLVAFVMRRRDWELR